MPEKMINMKKAKTGLLQTQQNFNKDAHKLQIDNIEPAKFPTNNIRGSYTTHNNLGGGTSTKLFKSMKTIPSSSTKSGANRQLSTHSKSSNLIKQSRNLLRINNSEISLTNQHNQVKYNQILKTLKKSPQEYQYEVQKHFQKSRSSQSRNCGAYNTLNHKQVKLEPYMQDSDFDDLNFHQQVTQDEELFRRTQNQEFKFGSKGPVLYKMLQESDGLKYRGTDFITPAKMSSSRQQTKSLFYAQQQRKFKEKNSQQDYQDISKWKPKNSQSTKNMKIVII